LNCLLNKAIWRVANPDFISRGSGHRTSSEYVFERTDTSVPRTCGLGPSAGWAKFANTKRYLVVRTSRAICRTLSLGSFEGQLDVAPRIVSYGAAGALGVPAS
jgi:hypothetical protein